MVGGWCGVCVELVCTTAREVTRSCGLVLPGSTWSFTVYHLAYLVELCAACSLVLAWLCCVWHGSPGAANSAASHVALLVACLPCSPEKGADVTDTTMLPLR